MSPNYKIAVKLTHTVLGLRSSGGSSSNSGDGSSNDSGSRRPRPRPKAVATGVRAGALESTYRFKICFLLFLSFPIWTNYIISQCFLL